MSRHRGRRRKPTPLAKAKPPVAGIHQVDTTMTSTPLGILKDQTDEAQRHVQRRLAEAGLDDNLTLPGIPMSGGLCLPICGALSSFLIDLGYEAGVLPVVTSVSDVTSRRRGYPTPSPTHWLPQTSDTGFATITPATFTATDDEWCGATTWSLVPLTKWAGHAVIVVTVGDTGYIYDPTLGQFRDNAPADPGARIDVPDRLLMKLPDPLPRRISFDLPRARVAYDVVPELVPSAEQRQQVMALLNGHLAVAS